MMGIVTKKITIDGKVVTIHGISTGFVSVKKKFRETNKKGILAILSFILDKEFTEWMPIWVWVIEHTEGIFVIDTGENSDITNKNYFKSSGWFANWLNTTQFKFKVNRDDEIDKQLEKISVNIEKVEKILLTHLHLDHTDGLRHFPYNKIYANKREIEKPYGNLPKLYPKWLKLLSIELDSEYKEFDKAKSITKNKDLMIVQTEGHTHGHSSYLLKTDEGYILFAGDVVYYQEQLVREKYAGANVNFKKSKETYLKIRNFSKKYKLVILPSHDKDAGNRLMEMKPIYYNSIGTNNI